MTDETEAPKPPKRLPCYQSHKTVRALKIKALHGTSVPDGSRQLEPEDQPGTEEQPYEVVVLSGDFMAKHKPEVGGYYVRYADGYESYSPAKAFEDGYDPIPDPEDEQPED
jgi:hypothetical protein